MTTGGQLNADVDQYLLAAASNVPPPVIVSDPVIPGVTPIEQLMGVLGLAANAGDLRDNAQSAEEHATRGAKLTDAADKFSAQDQAAEQELNSVVQQADPALTQVASPTGAAAAAAAEPASAMAQLPQAASSIAGAMSGALGGALQPVAQIPQQIAQGAQQVMQTGMGLFQQAGGAMAPVDDVGLALAPLGEDLGLGAGDLAGLGGGAGSGAAGGDLAGLAGAGGGGGGGDLAGLGAGGFGGTAPVSMLGPAPIPAASTAPSSSPLTQITPPAASTAAHAPGGGMSGMPMVPPGALAGSAGADKDAKADTRRVSVPPVRNGAPVQGRLTTPPPLPPVVKKEDGAPVVTRRVIVPRKLSEEDAADVKPDR
jgi:hypothetical protein